MDENNLMNRRNDVLEKLKERFKLKGVDAKELLQSLESYCELIIHAMKNE